MDLSEEQAPQDRNEEPLSSNISLLSIKKREENVYLFLKVVSFIIAVGLGAYFLCVGLQVAKDSAKHIKDVQMTVLEIEKNRSKKEPVIGTNSKAAKTEAKQLSASKEAVKETAKEENTTAPDEPNGSFIFATGSLLTLVAFILGTGLTLLLSLLKFVFINNQHEQNISNSPDIATPLSELIKGLSDWLKKKVK